uniref:Immunoglobulin V-set domain-containing protein n=1 Tax=Astyanax mexicanus TaxID=7994 RepID=A0A3B1K2S0_ASTMX
QVTVDQTPTVKSVSAGESLSISCRFRPEPSSCSPTPCVSWYQRKPGEAPKLLIYRVSEQTVQGNSRSYSSGSGSGSSSTLTISLHPPLYSISEMNTANTLQNMG